MIPIYAAINGAKTAGRWIKKSAKNYGRELWEDPLTRLFLKEDAPNTHVGGFMNMGVSYTPGQSPILPQKLNQWLQDNNGKWTPFTWQGADGRRYRFAPIDGWSRSITKTFFRTRHGWVPTIPVNIFGSIVSVIGGKNQVQKWRHEANSDQHLKEAYYLSEAREYFKDEKDKSIVRDYIDQVEREIASSQDARDLFDAQYNNIEPNYNAFGERLAKLFEKDSLSCHEYSKPEFSEKLFSLYSKLENNAEEKLILEKLIILYTQRSFFPLRDILFNDLRRTQASLQLTDDSIFARELKNPKQQNFCLDFTKASDLKIVSELVDAQLELHYAYFLTDQKQRATEWFKDFEKEKPRTATEFASFEESSGLLEWMKEVPTLSPTQKSFYLMGFFDIKNRYTQIYKKLGFSPLDKNGDPIVPLALIEELKKKTLSEE